VRPNACSLWEDQNEPSDSDIQAIKELVPVRKIQNVVTDGMCLTELKIYSLGGKIALTPVDHKFAEEYSRRLKLLKLEYETKQTSIDEEESEAIQSIYFEFDKKRDTMVEAYERDLQLLQSAWEAHKDQIG